MTIAKDISDLLSIADRAVTVQRAEIERRNARNNLNFAYRDWKHRNGIDHVNRDSLEWIQMMVATKPEHEILTRAKQRERNARKRLNDAVRRSGVIEIGSPEI